MKFSIIVPFHNSCEWLSVCLESVSRQSFRDFELILVDDCSSDESGLIAKKFCEENNFARLISKSKNEGVNYARRDGFLSSSGEFIVFVDSDDQIHEDFLKVASESFDCDFDIIIFGASKKPLNNYANLKVKLRKEHPSKMIFRQLVFPIMKNIYPMTVWGKCYNRRILEKINWERQNYKLHEDEFMSLQVFRFSQKILTIKNKMYFYRYRQNSLSKTKLHKSENLKIWRDFFEFGFEILGSKWLIPLKICYFRNVIIENLKHK